jgi:molybdopterin converting factor small subunit
MNYCPISELPCCEFYLNKDMATVIIPTPLRKYTGNAAACTTGASTVHDAITGLTDKFPDLKKHLVNERGELQSFINIFVDQDDIRHLNEGDTLIRESSVISIIPAIAGG